MKRFGLFGRVSALAALLCAAFNVAFADSTFTYQGVLRENNAPKNGSVLLRFSLFNDSGTQVGSSLDRTVNVSGGLFTTTLDFGDSAFDGGGRSLQIQVITGGGATITTLSPRQTLTYAPHAFVAQKARSLQFPFYQSGTASNAALMSIYNSAGDGTGVYARLESGFGYNFPSAAFWGDATTTDGVHGTSSTGVGVYGYSLNGSGVYARTDGGYGLTAYGGNIGTAINATASSGLGMSVSSNTGRALYAYSSGNVAIDALSTTSYGLRATSSGSSAIYAISTSPNSVTAVNVRTDSPNSNGVVAETNGTLYPYAFWGRTNNANGYAGYFSGKVNVSGTLSKGGGSFKIDHPLDPENKFLYHSFVESPDMMNVYNGNAKLNAQGEAWVTLPEWFETLNRDFRYQLTAMGAPSPNLYVAQEVSGNRFKIAGGAPNGSVSWQITGIRQDAFANAHRIPVEEEKREDEKGYYLYPVENGQPAEKGLDYKRAQETMPTPPEDPRENPRTEPSKG